LLFPIFLVIFVYHRIEGGLENKTFKFKSFEFKVLEGIAKDSGVIDEEEAQG